MALQKGIIYGPVTSRRLGRSLGINLMSTKYKACSYNCVYCHYGWTKVLASDMAGMTGDLPAVEEVGRALAAALEAGASPEYITFSGNGEPTLHPAFPEVVKVVVELRDRLAPQARTCVLSNATGLTKAGVAEALRMLDVRILKLDAGDEQTWRLVNRPAPELSFAALLDGLKRNEDWVMQTLFCDGPGGNCGPQQLERWMERVGQLRPQQVQIYSIDRPAADGRLQKVSLEALEAIAVETFRQTGVAVHVYGAAAERHRLDAK